MYENGHKKQEMKDTGLKLDLLDSDENVDFERIIAGLQEDGKMPFRVDKKAEKEHARMEREMNNPTRIINISTKRLVDIFNQNKELKEGEEETTNYYCTGNIVKDKRSKENSYICYTKDSKIDEFSAKAIKRFHEEHFNGIDAIVPEEQIIKRRNK
jgi:hypothetical protein